MDLQTKNTILVKYQPSDFEAFCEVICNDEVMLHISGKGYSREIALEKFNDLLKTNKENDHYGFYKVLLKDSESLIGFAKMVPYEEDTIEIGYALLPDYWRKGYISEMIESMTLNCIQNFKDLRVIAIVDDSNIGSLKVLELQNFHIYKKEHSNGSPCCFMEHRD